MLLIKSSKLSIPRNFSMSIILKILTGLLLSLILTFTALFQNQVDWILPAFFSWRHLYASWWFSWHMLSDMKSLPENLSWCRSLDLFQRFFLLTSTLRLSFLHLNFTITDSFFFKQWQACKSSDSRKKKLWKIMLNITSENYQQLPCCKSTTKQNFLYWKIEPVNLSESTINLIGAFKIILFWILSQLASPYRSKSAKAVSESFKILTLITLRSSKRVLRILL